MEREELEALAEAMLAPHRSTPPPSEPVRDEELPPALRLYKRVDPNWSMDREQLERLQAYQRRHSVLAKMEGTVTLIGGALLLAFLLAAYSAF